jgi:hypothetical protein
MTRGGDAGGGFDDEQGDAGPGEAGRQCRERQDAWHLAAQAALGKGIKQVIFDRGGARYHGKVKALADAAREAGLQF